MFISCLGRPHPGHAIHSSSRGSLCGFFHPLPAASIDSNGLALSPISSVDASVDSWQHYIRKHPSPLLPDALKFRYLGESDVKVDMQPEPLGGCGGVSLKCVPAERLLVSGQVIDFFVAVSTQPDHEA